LKGEKMRILVIDDSPVNCALARQQLAGEHDLTITSSYDEATKLLGGKDFANPISRNTFEHDFEVVLVDLLLPAPATNLCQEGRDSFAGQEMPLGIFLALLAAKNGSETKVAMFTDASHHAHPASACVDAFQRHETKPQEMRVGTSSLWLVNNRSWVRDFPEGRGKDWSSLLRYLHGDIEEEAGSDETC
jgi:CheY-like chemotaxis protein